MGSGQSFQKFFSRFETQNEPIRHQDAGSGFKIPSGTRAAPDRGKSSKSPKFQPWNFQAFQDDGRKKRAGQDLCVFFRDAKPARQTVGQI